MGLTQSGPKPRTPSEVLAGNIEAAVSSARSLEAMLPQLTQAAKLLTHCFTSGHKLLTCGNGGSAADAAHLATEFVVRYVETRRHYPAICLSTPGTTFTAMCNDFGFDEVFARQVYAFGKPGDVLIAISTSGNSTNVKLALDVANRSGISTIAFLGKGGGVTRGIAGIEFLVEQNVTARVQEAHLLLYHCLCELVDAELIRLEAPGGGGA